LYVVGGSMGSGSLLSPTISMFWVLFFSRVHHFIAGSKFQTPPAADSLFCYKVKISTIILLRIQLALISPPERRQKTIHHRLNLTSDEIHCPHACALRPFAPYPMLYMSAKNQNRYRLPHGARGQHWILGAGGAMKGDI